MANGNGCGRWLIIGLLSFLLWGGIGSKAAMGNPVRSATPTLPMVAQVHLLVGAGPPSLNPLPVRSPSPPPEIPPDASPALGGDPLPPAVAEPMPRAIAPKNALAEAERRELEQLRLESQIQRTIRDSLTRSPEMQDRIELEVDRAFGRTTTILNVLLAILTGIPILVALFVWLLRRSVISELVGEVRTQLEKEVYSELKTQTTAAIEEIEFNKAASLTQLSQIVKEAQTVLDELKTQIKIANDEMDALKSQTAFQLETMVSDAESVKSKTLQELASLLPLSTQDSLPPDVQPRIGRLTDLLDSLKSAIPQLTFTASDYIKQGNALFFESRYEDAIAAHDKAIQLDPDLYEAWFGKASSLVVLQHYDEALDAYHRALALKPESVEAWFGKASVLRKLHQTGEAIAAFEKASTLKPEDGRIWLNLGALLVEMQQYEGAIAAFDQALTLKPDAMKAYLGKAEALRALNQLDDALAICEAALKLNAEDPELWYAKAICFALQANSMSATYALACAIRHNAAYRERACEDPTFATIRDTPEFRLRVSDQDHQ